MHSVAFHIGSLAIYWYGIFTGLGFLAAFWTAMRRAPRAGLNSDAISDLAPWIIVGAIVGARLFYVVSYWNEEFAGKPLWEIFMLRRGGVVYYGGLIGSPLATIWYAYSKRLPLWRIADVLAPSIALGHAFGRIGCLMTGCCYGSKCNLPWAIHFPATHWTGGNPVHPTQIYEAILNLGLYGFLVWLMRRKQFEGQIFAAYLIAYACLRSLVELFRGDYPNTYFGGWVTPAHFASAITLAIGLFLFWKLRSSEAARKMGELRVGPSSRRT